MIKLTRWATALVVISGLLMGACNTEENTPAVVSGGGAGQSTGGAGAVGGVGGVAGSAQAGQGGANGGEAGLAGGAG